MRLFGRLFAVFAVSICSLADANVAAQTTDGDKQYVYVTGHLPGRLVNMDPDTIRDRPSDLSLRPFPVRQAWFFWLEWNEKTRSIKETKMLISASCETEKAAILKSITYTGRKIDGEVEQDDRVESYDHSIPGSLGYSQLRALCDR